MQIYWTKINEIIQEAPEVRTYLMERPEDFVWEEGSHTHFALEGFNADDKPNRDLIRHMSISTMPNENLIGITTRIKAECSIFKTALKDLEVGNEVAIFKTRSNVPLKREGKNVYLLSSGVGIATYRPIVLSYFENAEGVNQMHSLNIDSSKAFLFTDVFKTEADKNFSAQFVDTRSDYYEQVRKIAADENGLFYVVGSDEFLVQNISVLVKEGVEPENIMLDKYEESRAELLSSELSV
ncbi:dihydropteridine reductase [Salinicoccus hispanicus]|uniref:Dihydropteridine reductase n=1 Tax=Salinicoccus hispanicus TaxID=157225 RepID=A0A6N8TWD2_9STAP|nr:dihydropteridine reductase [Salinicoccus hispanicus]MXQ50000.1 dihydropteridine reductase [Salinicoccus hispanicus]